MSGRWLETWQRSCSREKTDRFRPTGTPGSFLNDLPPERG